MPGATFALDPQMLDEYAYLSVPRELAPAKAILKARYGDRRATSAKSVYEGCSGGGRQGLIQAQRPTAIAVASPPPMHRLLAPSSVTRMRAPVAPMGCPSEQAPQLALTR